jgi:hypothetical protein
MCTPPASAARRIFGDSDDDDDDDDDDYEEREHVYGCDAGTCPDDSVAAPSGGVHPGTTRVIFVAANWDKAALAAMLDASLLRAPPLQPHAAGVDDADGDEAALREANDDHWSRNAARGMLDEIVRASTVDWACHLGAYLATGRQPPTYSMRVPRLRYLLSLQPDAATAGGAGGSAAAAAAGGEAGVLTVRLFALRATSNTGLSTDVCKPLFDADPSTHTPHGEDTTCLRETLDALWMAHSPAHAANDATWRALERAHGADAAVCTLPGLLNAVEAQERPEAPQPPGLTVQLRPYQRQSLRFMLDAERGVSRDVIWCERALPDGTQAWYSKMLHRITLVQPHHVCGGFLCEEMGLVRSSCACVAGSLVCSASCAPHCTH